MLYQRGIHVPADRDLLLDFHCLGNHESDSPRAREMSFAEYRAEWLRTEQPLGFLGALTESLNDPRTVAELWLDDTKVIGFLWVTFLEIEGYGLTVAEVQDVEVVPDYQHRGIGTQMLAHAETLAREHGAQIIRSETGIENEPSRGLHEKSGYVVYRLLYEKVIDAEGDPPDVDDLAEPGSSDWDAVEADTNSLRFPPREEFPRL
ncbi:MAG: GNAT family N-acetyltransferase [Dehalococcoidia bacterium]|nr:GNAT family N-acetyltransferase [Dehalococcoidia bacterium]